MSNLNVCLSQVSSSHLLKVLLFGAGKSGFCATRSNSVHTGNRFIQIYADNPRHLYIVPLSDKDTDYLKLNEKTSIFRDHTLESSDGQIKYHIGFVFEKNYVLDPEPCKIGGLYCGNDNCPCCFGIGYVMPYNLVSSGIEIYESCENGKFEKANLSLTTDDIVKLVKKHELLVEMRRMQEQLENF